MSKNTSLKLCSYCNFYESSNVAALKKHEVNCWANVNAKNPESTNWTCHLCGERQMTSKILKKHLKVAHSTIKKNICEWCNYSNKETEILFHQYHVSKCSKNPHNKIYTCEKCSLYSSSNHQAYQTHKHYCDGGMSSKYYCAACDLEFSCKALYKEHGGSLMHGEAKENKLPLECSYCSRLLTTRSAYTIHEKYCKSNANSIEFTGRPHSEETKMKISQSMKELHAQNIAHRWQNPHLYTSYPEEFFIKIIDNEFTDKEYIKELNMGKYFLDFAWLHKMKAIEIDGSQHERFQHQKESDARKDALARDMGWKILRIKWSDLYNDPKKYIKIAKDFIHIM